MYYSIVAEDVENSAEKRRQARVAHLQRLHVLNQQGRLLIAGPHFREDQANNQIYTGSLIVAQFESLADAEEWANADPFLQTGVYAKVIVTPFLKVLP